MEESFDKAPTFNWENLHSKTVELNWEGLWFAYTFGKIFKRIISREYYKFEIENILIKEIF